LIFLIALRKKKASKIIDAKGKYIFPGGIDPHVHMHLPSHAGYSSDDFRTGSIAALFGGTTTIIDFVTPRKKQNLIEAFKERLKEAENILTDFSFHISPVDLHSGIQDEIKELIDRGITSFKVYMAYKNTIGLEDDVLLEVMKIISNNGALLTVHAETGDEVEELRTKYAEENCLSPEYHALSRPDKTEFEAVKKVIEFSEKTGCKVYIVHVSAKESVELIAEAQKRGLSVFGETCPQYLLQDDSKLKGTFENTAAFVFSPPLRKKEDQTELWKALKNGTLQTTGTDHCPFTFEQKKAGENDFRKIPNGTGGVEHRLGLLYTYGVLKEKINLNDFVKITSTNAAKIFGLYPRKGEIAVGSDADLIIWDPSEEYTISKNTHKQNCDLNIYEGTKLNGAPEYIIKGGKIVFNKNVLYLENIQANFLKRTL
jgi:dihydropyrimidinase